MSKDRGLMSRVFTPLLKPRPLLLLLQWCVSVCVYVCVCMCVRMCACACVHMFPCVHMHTVSVYDTVYNGSTENEHPEKFPSITETQILSILELAFFGIRYSSVLDTQKSAFFLKITGMGLI